ncbi:MAG: hypothetical protein U0075_10165 [Thermomicrobiales bacterium]
MDSAGILLTNIDSNAPTTRTVNTAMNPGLASTPGKPNWRLANLRKRGHLLRGQLTTRQAPRIIGEDGNPVWRVKASIPCRLPRAKRFDPGVQGGEPGTWSSRRLQYDQQGRPLSWEPSLATVTVNHPVKPDESGRPASETDPERTTLSRGVVDAHDHLLSKDQAATVTS